MSQDPRLAAFLCRNELKNLVESGRYVLNRNNAT
jgi:hypothetical protein